jgi:hypothetical protein
MAGGGAYKSIVVHRTSKPPYQCLNDACGESGTRTRTGTSTRASTREGCATGWGGSCGSARTRSTRASGRATSATASGHTSGTTAPSTPASSGATSWRARGCTCGRTAGYVYPSAPRRFVFLTACGLLSTVGRLRSPDILHGAILAARAVGKLFVVPAGVLPVPVSGGL